MVGFTSVNMTVNEGDGNISVPVALAPDIAGTVTVSFNIISGSAVEGDGQLFITWTIYVDGKISVMMTRFIVLNLSAITHAIEHAPTPG